MDDVPLSPLPHGLLVALQGLVQSDTAPPRLSGLIVVAVKGETETSIWHAAFEKDGVRGCGYLEGVPPDADAILLFDRAQADRAIAGELPLGEVFQYGEGDLLQNFTERYCTFRSAIDIRAGG